MLELSTPCLDSHHVLNALLDSSAKAMLLHLATPLVPLDTTVYLEPNTAQNIHVILEHTTMKLEPKMKALVTLAHLECIVKALDCLNHLDSAILATSAHWAQIQQHLRQPLTAPYCSNALLVIYQLQVVSAGLVHSALVDPNFQNLVRLACIVIALALILHQAHVKQVTSATEVPVCLILQNPSVHLVTIVLVAQRSQLLALEVHSLGVMATQMTRTANHALLATSAAVCDWRNLRVNVMVGSTVLQVKITPHHQSMCALRDTIALMAPICPYLVSEEHTSQVTNKSIV